MSYKHFGSPDILRIQLAVISLLKPSFPNKFYSLVYPSRSPFLLPTVIKARTFRKWLLLLGAQHETHGKASLRGRHHPGCQLPGGTNQQLRGLREGGQIECVGAFFFFFLLSCLEGKRCQKSLCSAPPPTPWENT